jgi:hypothetical protein
MFEDAWNHKPLKKNCLSCLLLREVFIWISPSAGSRYSSVFYGVFVSEEADGVVDKGSGDTTMVNVQTLLLSFLNMCPNSACFIDEALF